MARIVGEHADPQPNPNWWLDHQEVRDRMVDNAPGALFCIDNTFHQLVRVERLRDANNDNGAKRIAGLVLYQLNAFLGLQPNGPFISLMEEHIKDRGVLRTLLAFAFFLHGEREDGGRSHPYFQSPGRES